MSDNNQRYDAVIIGSGIGSLTCAALLARLWQKKVLVLEKHFKAGGFTHIFRRNKTSTYEWDVGLHYVGEMQKGQPPRAIFDYITAGGVRWHKMADPYDVFIYPDLTFKACSGTERFTKDLGDMFPAEREAIRHYVDDIKTTAAWSGRGLLERNLPAVLRPLGKLIGLPGKKRALMTTADYLNSHFQDEKLRAVLASQWGDYGLPPGQSAFLVHAIIASHYLAGAYYPVGGAKTIADAIIPVIEAQGGQVLVGHSAEKIIFSNKRAIGVKAVHHRKDDNDEEKEFFTDTIISGIGALNTYTKLLPPDYQLPFRQELNDFPLSPANVTAYLGLKDDPRKIGYQGENLWIYDSYNHDENFARRNRLYQGEITACYVSCPSLKNPLAKGHTMELISFVDFAPFAEWANQPWKNRDDNYEQLKQRILDTMIGFVAKRLPGLSELIDYRELSTPLSTEHFTGHRAGSIYGLAAVPDKFTRRWLKIRSDIRNLYLTGSDIGIHGIVGAMMGGVITTAMIQGMPGGMMKIFKNAFKYSNSLKDQN